MSEPVDIRGRFRPYRSQRGVEKHGPCWQFSCHDCSHMSDCYDTKSERDKAAKRHRCHACESCGAAIVDDTGERGGF